MILGSLSYALGDGDALPPELLDRDKCLLEMRILGDEVGAEVDGKPLRDENVWGGLRKI